MKDFEGTTYQEWLEYHRKVTYPAIVESCLDNIRKEGIYKSMPVYFEIKKEK